MVFFDKIIISSLEHNLLYNIKEYCCWCSRTRFYSPTDHLTQTLEGEKLHLHSPAATVVLFFPPTFGYETEEFFWNFFLSFLKYVNTEGFRGRKRPFDRRFSFMSVWQRVKGKKYRREEYQTGGRLLLYDQVRIYIRNWLNWHRSIKHFKSKRHHKNLVAPVKDAI